MAALTAPKFCIHFQASANFQIRKNGKDRRRSRQPPVPIFLHMWYIEVSDACRSDQASLIWRDRYMKEPDRHCSPNLFLEMVYHLSNSLALTIFFTAISCFYLWDSVADLWKSEPFSLCLFNISDCIEVGKFVCDLLNFFPCISSFNCANNGPKTPFALGSLLKSPQTYPSVSEGLSLLFLRLFLAYIKMVHSQLYIRWNFLIRPCRAGNLLDILVAMVMHTGTLVTIACELCHVFFSKFHFIRAMFVWACNCSRTLCNSSCAT